MYSILRMATQKSYSVERQICTTCIRSMWKENNQQSQRDLRMHFFLSSTVSLCFTLKNHSHNSNNAIMPHLTHKNTHTMHYVNLGLCIATYTHYLFKLFDGDDDDDDDIFSTFVIIK